MKCIRGGLTVPPINGVAVKPLSELAWRTHKQSRAVGFNRLGLSGADVRTYLVEGLREITIEHRVVSGWPG